MGGILRSRPYLTAGRPARDPKQTGAEIETHTGAWTPEARERAHRIGHEARRPLAVVRANAELLRDRVSGDLNPEQMEQVASVLRGAQRLEHLVGDLVDLCDHWAGSAALRLASCDLRELVRSTADRMLFEFTRRCIGLSVALPDGPVEAPLDAQRVGALVRRALTDALARPRPGGGVALRLTADAERARIEIEPSGPGFASEGSAELFRPFATGDPGEAPDGLAIELALCRAEAELHGGAARFEAAGEDRTVLVFELPVGRRQETPATVAARLPSVEWQAMREETR